MNANKQLTKQDDSRQHEARSRGAVPVCDIYENADEYLIVAEMPGVEQQAVDLRLDRTRLTIEADRSNGDAVTHYARVFEVPATIDAARISAKLSEGLLAVHLPKAPEARVRRIAVTSG